MTMSYFSLCRTLFFVWFTILNAIIVAAAAINLTSSSRSSSLNSVDMYLMFSSSFSIVFVFPIILIDVLRRGALTSKVWFECAWLFICWIMNLSGAAAVTALSSAPTCLRTGGVLSCSSTQVLMGVTWTTTLIVLAQFAAILVSSIYYSKRFPEVWTTSVRDFKWWSGGGATELHSSPSSPTFMPKKLALDPKNPVPHLERMAEQWNPAPGVQVHVQAMTIVPGAKPVSSVKSIDEPQPLTLAYAPEVNPARAPVHYSATAVISVGVLPQRKPSKKLTQTAPSLYASGVQQALGGSTTSAQVPAASAPSDEPVPIKNWPRVNPQDPFRKKQTGSAPVVASRNAAEVLPIALTAPIPAPLAPFPSSSNRRSSRGPRPRPPPLDLSKARPNQIR